MINMDHTSSTIFPRGIDLVSFSYTDFPYEINLEDIPSNNFPSWIVATENRLRDTVYCSGYEQTSTMETNCKLLQNSIRSNGTYIRSYSYDSAAENSFEHVNRWATSNGIRSEVRNVRKYGWVENANFDNYKEAEGKDYTNCTKE